MSIRVSAISLFYFFSILLLLVIKPERFEGFSYSFNFILSLVFAILILSFLIAHHRVEKNWLRFDVIFLVGYAIVHMQIPFLASIGIEPLRPNFIWLNKDVVNFATWMSVVAINFWMFGYSLIFKQIGSENFKNRCSSRVNTKFVDIFLIILFLGFLATAGGTILKGVYNVNAWGSGATHFLLLLKVAIYLRLFYFFSRIPEGTTIKGIIIQAKSQMIFSMVLLLFLVLFMFSGSRGEILRVLLLVAFLYSVYVKKVSLRFLIVSITVGAILFTIMGLGRSREAADFSQANLFERGYEALIEGEKRANYTDELASSVRIQYRALDVVPWDHPYLLGVSYIGTIVGVVPFASGLVIDALSIPYQYQGTARFFTYLGQGSNITYGEGSEILADLYVNFGLYFTFLIMTLFGLISAVCLKNLKRGSRNYLFVYSIFLITALSMNRGTIFYVYKDIFYMFFLNAIFVNAGSWLGSKVRS